MCESVDFVAPFIVAREIPVLAESEDNRADRQHSDAERKNEDTLVRRVAPVQNEISRQRRHGDIQRKSNRQLPKA